MKMQAAVCREYKKPITIEEVELAPPKENEVLVKTAYTGFCHSDWGAVAGWVGFPIPMVIGHEASGVVVDTGPGVTSVKKGDHVVATWMVACGHCPECTSGQGLYLQNKSWFTHPRQPPGWHKQAYGCERRKAQPPDCLFPVLPSIWSFPNREPLRYRKTFHWMWLVLWAAACPPDTGPSTM